MKNFGWFLLVVAGAVGGYALLIFDPTVSTGMGRVYNIGQLQFRQNLLIFAGVLAIVGVVMAVFSPGAPQTQDDPQKRLFEAAIENGDLAKMTEMLDSGALDPNGALTKSQSSWLRYAMNLKKLDACELLLKRGADPNKVDGFGISPLQTLVNLTPTKGSTERAILGLFRNPPAVEVAARVAPHSPITGGQTPEKTTIAQQLTELAKLKETGHLSAEEYDLAKARILA